MTRQISRLVPLFAVPLCVLIVATVAQGGQGRHGGRSTAAPEVFLTDVPPTEGNILLARPTDTSVALSILLKRGTRAVVSYGEAGGSRPKSSEVLDVKPGEPCLYTITGLQADKAYSYELKDAKTGEKMLGEGGSGTFHTARKAGSAFTFVVQSDSHLDANSSPDVYRAALKNALADNPDFMMDLGDTFMTGKHASRETALKQYDAQRYYFGLIGHAVPLFLVLGNHDGEETKRPDAAKPGGLAIWSNQQRRRLFPNPVPDRFYTGNSEDRPDVGKLEDYYAFTWGDALFVALDPYWYSGSARGGQSGWSPTIGKAQYDWLAKTLRGSKAKFKFIFIHQLTGGYDKSGRGGTEVAPLFEWGGSELDGTRTFTQNRPGWGMPIHSLLKETGVTVVFHGHDHFYAHQQLDGIIYQLVPQPSQRLSRNDHSGEYGYKDGKFLPSSGHLRVRVGKEGVKVDYVGATVGPERPGQMIQNGKVAHTFTCLPGSEKRQ